MDDEERQRFVGSKPSNEWRTCDYCRPKLWFAVFVGGAAGRHPAIWASSSEQSHRHSFHHCPKRIVARADLTKLIV